MALFIPVSVPFPYGPFPLIKRIWGRMGGLGGRDPLWALVKGGPFPPETSRQYPASAVHADGFEDLDLVVQRMHAADAHLHGHAGAGTFVEHAALAAHVHALCG